jgi:hypothetical protein
VNRREAVLATLSAAVSLAIAPLASADVPAKTPLWLIRRYDRPNDSWVICRLFHLRPGDLFDVDENTIWLATGEPEQLPDGVWSIASKFRSSRQPLTGVKA